MKLYQNICFAGSRTEAGNLWQCHRCVISLSYSLSLLFKGLNLGHLEVNDLWDFGGGGDEQYKYNVFFWQRWNEQSPGESKLP